MAKIIKLSDDYFEGAHPNGINEGFETNSFPGETAQIPIVGQRYNFGELKTSIVKEVISKTDEEFVFKTLYSTYKVIR